MYEVYVIQSKTSGKIYIGQTNNETKRILRHNSVLQNNLTSYTSKNKGPWVVIYREIFQTRSEAIKREKQLKSHKGRDWLKIKLNGPVAQR